MADQPYRQTFRHDPDEDPAFACVQKVPDLLSVALRATKWCLQSNLAEIGGVVQRAEDLLSPPPGDPAQFRDLRWPILGKQERHRVVLRLQEARNQCDRPVGKAV